MIEFDELQKIINKAERGKPPKWLVDYCDDYFERYYWLFYLVSQKLKTKGVAVELGVNKGRGSYALARGGMKTIGIDHTRHEEIDGLEKLDNFTFIESDTLPVPSEIEGNKIVVLHVDTEHSYSMAQNEFDGYRPYFVDGAVVFFDDMNAQEREVARYFYDLTGFKKYESSKLHPPCGFGVVQFRENH